MPEVTGSTVTDPFVQVSTARRVVEKAGFQKQEHRSTFRPSSTGGLWFDVVIPVRFESFALDDEALVAYIHSFIRGRCGIVGKVEPKVPLPVGEFTPSREILKRRNTETQKEDDPRPSDLRSVEGRAWRARHKLVEAAT